MSKTDRKVLMLAYPFPPLAVAGSFRTLRFARYLPEFGWQPLVLTRDAVSDDGDVIGQGLLNDVPAGILVSRKGLWRPLESSFNLAKRVLRPQSKKECDNHLASEHAGSVGAHREREYRGLGSSLRKLVESLVIPDRQIGWFLPALRQALSLVRQHRPEIILSSSPPVSSHLIAVTLKRLTGLPVVLDFRDPWARKNWPVPVSSENAFRRTMHRRLERWCVRHADRVLLNTNECRDDFVNTYGAELSKKFFVLTNGYDPKVLLAAAESQGASKAVNTNGVLRLCHPGTVYQGRNLRPLISAIAQLSRSGRHVILDQVGGFGDSEPVLPYAERLGVRSHIVLHGQLSQNETLRHMARADIFVLIHPGTTLTIPCKLFEMLPFRRPVLALTEPGAADTRLVNHYELGVSVPPDDENSIARAILALADGHAKYPLEVGWRQALCEFDGRRLTGELGTHLDACVTLSSQGRRRASQLATDASAEKSMAQIL